MRLPYSQFYVTFALLRNIKLTNDHCLTKVNYFPFYLKEQKITKQALTSSVDRILISAAAANGGNVTACSLPYQILRVFREDTESCLYYWYKGTCRPFLIKQSSTFIVR